MRFLFCICACIVLVFSLTSSLWALDEYSHETKAGRGFICWERGMGYEFKHKVKYSFNERDVTCNEYGVGGTVDLFKHCAAGLEYTFIDNLDDGDEHELEGKFEVFFDTFFDIEVKNENKFITEFSENDYFYENESKLRRPIFKLNDGKSILYALAEDTLVYDFQDGDLTENEVCAGVLFKLFDGMELQAKYCYVDVLDSSEYETKLETEACLSF